MTQDVFMARYCVYKGQTRKDFVRNPALQEVQKEILLSKRQHAPQQRVLIEEAEESMVQERECAEVD